MNQRFYFSILTIFFLLLNPLFLWAAEADFMRSIGKIYVVIGVIVLIFIGIILYMIRLDRKLTNIENQIKE